jgi:hypothetical protein
MPTRIDSHRYGAGHPGERREAQCVNPSSVARKALTAGALAALLTSCDRAETAGVALPPAAVSGTQTLPNAAGRDLIYAGGDEASYVLTTGGKLVTTLAQTSFGLCSDRFGDVFFTEVNGIVEYRHGGTSAIATFAAPGTVYSCSVDPVTGNLAAVVFCLSKCGEEVVVLRAPGEPPKVYHDPALTSLLYCAYDDAGNLFVDGSDGAEFGLTELSKRGHAFARIALKRKIDFGAQIQWDGRNVAIETREHPAIYRVRITGLTGRVIGTTQLTGVGGRATQSWIAEGSIAVPTGPSNKRAIEILFWKYPAGGNPTKTFRGFVGSGHQTIDGVTLSVAPQGYQSRFRR